VDQVSVNRLTNGPATISGSQLPGGSRESLESQKAGELAHEFESMLLLQMLRQMRQSALAESDDGEEDGFSASTMIDTVDAELARQLSKSGGIGVADVLMRAIQRQTSGAAQADTLNPSEIIGIPADRTNWIPAPTPGVETNHWTGDGLTSPGPVTAGVDSGRLTSDYGWRADPFTGRPRLHQGIDLRAAYGQEVPAAAPGLVVEAGDRGAYGTTIVIEHESGVQTRYAHLSTVNVGVGERVLQGQEIGRVGQSGRATGPHLHFEVLRDGQRIDPSTVVTLYGSGLGGLKLAGAGADSLIGGRTHTPATIGADDED
jgi:murein DD-endopeptidase MepM/ murein hydrolase activator NlpD